MVSEQLPIVKPLMWKLLLQTELYNFPASNNYIWNNILCIEIVIIIIPKISQDSRRYAPGVKDYENNARISSPNRIW